MVKLSIGNKVNFSASAIKVKMFYVKITVNITLRLTTSTAILAEM